MYLTVDLTTKGKRCGFWPGIGLKTICYMRTGMTTTCAEIFAFNTRNTAKHCKGICLKYFFFGRSINNNEDGSLNECLQCDKENSGPVFKYYAGRTRRSSGIVSEIGREDSEIVSLEHCYN